MSRRCPATVNLAGDLTQSTAVRIPLQTHIPHPPPPPVPSLCSDRLQRLAFGAERESKVSFPLVSTGGRLHLAWF